MRILLTLVFALLAITANAKTETYDIATFELPQGWNQEYAKNHLSLSTVNKKKRTWCKIGLFKSIDSAGAVEADFTRDWKLLVLTPMAARDETPQRHTRTADGWTITTAGRAKILAHPDIPLALQCTRSSQFPTCNRQPVRHLPSCLRKIDYGRNCYCYSEHLED